MYKLYNCDTKEEKDFESKKALQTELLKKITQICTFDEDTIYTQLRVRVFKE